MKIKRVFLTDLTESLIHGIKKIMDEGYKNEEFKREFNPIYFTRNIASMLSADLACLFVAEERSMVCGVMAGMVFPDFTSDVWMAAEIIWRVDPRMGRGYGGKLYDKFDGWAREKGAQIFLMLSMHGKDEQKTDSFYASRGYTFHGKQWVRRA